MRPNIEELRARLRIDKHRLDEELETHSQIQEQIAHTVSQLNTAANEAKEALGLMESTLALEAKEDDPKLTAAGVEATVRKHRKRIAAWQLYQAARAEHEEWTGLLSAWVSRGYGIKTLAELHAQQYYSITSVTQDPEARALRMDYDRTSFERKTLRRRPTT